MVDDKAYYEANLQNLLRDIADPATIEAALANIGDLRPERMLDVGCGIGQAMFPYAVTLGVEGVGVDIGPSGLAMGKKFRDEHLPDAKLSYVRAVAEFLPFADASFDLVNCGLALPYMDNAKAINEIARVTRPGGIFLLKIHHPRYYVRELWRGLKLANADAIVHGSRVLVAGTLYHLFKRQPKIKFLSETFQTRWLLAKELAKHGFAIEQEQVRTNLLTPAYVIRKGN